MFFVEKFFSKETTEIGEDEIQDFMEKEVKESMNLEYKSPEILDSTEKRKELTKEEQKKAERMVR